MPGVYGFLQGLVVVVFGTVVGDWVDFNPRLRGACCSGRVQGGVQEGECCGEGVLLWATTVASLAVHCCLCSMKRIQWFWVPGPSCTLQSIM